MIPSLVKFVQLWIILFLFCTTTIVVAEGGNEMAPTTPHVTSSSLGAGPQHAARTRTHRHSILTSSSANILPHNTRTPDNSQNHHAELSNNNSNINKNDKLAGPKRIANKNESYNEDQNSKRHHQIHQELLKLQDDIASIHRRHVRRILKFINPLRRRSSRLDQMQPTRRKKIQMYLTCFVIVFTWVALGTLFYSYYNDWPLPQSFFYAVDAGMSIGFCTDVAETKVASRAFTVVYILLGASCVGGALALMVQNIIDSAASRSSALYKHILERDSFKKAFFQEGGGRSFVTSLTRGLSGKKKGTLLYDDFRQALEQDGCTLSDDSFLKVCALYDPCQNGFIDFDDFSRIFQGIDRILPSTHYVHCNPLLVRILAHIWNAFTSLFTNEDRRIYLIFILWVGMGITWGINDQHWDPITATHFAVSALATGGLTAPPVDENGILPAGPAIFCGMYCLFGIPLFALTLGQFARVLVEGYIVEEEHAAITRPLSRSEFQFASKICSKDDAIHLSDFIVLQLFRQGKLSVESLEFMKRQFELFDKNQSGRLSWNEATLNELSDDRQWLKFQRNRINILP